MTQSKSNICAPQGFAAAGIYSGICDRRVKLDLAMVVSRTDCSIVTAEASGVCQSQGRAVVYHNGLALPTGQRGNEITAEAKDAVASSSHIPAEAISFMASGQNGYFRPSLLVNSVSALTAGLSPYHASLVGTVLDCGSDVASGEVKFHSGSGDYVMGGILADGVDGQPGICFMTTDLAATSDQLEEALQACKATFDLADYKFIVMANGAAGSLGGKEGTHGLTQMMNSLLEQLGAEVTLKICS